MQLIYNSVEFVQELIVQTAIQERTTKYTLAVRSLLNNVGHASNSEIHEALLSDFPNLSATTVHRITTRMYQRGEILIAPSRSDNALRYDSNATPHDHFLCMNCGILKDTNVEAKIKPILEATIGDDCHISGRLTVSGLCKNCSKKLKK